MQSLHRDCSIVAEHPTIIYSSSVSNINNANDRMFVATKEEKLRDILDDVLKERTPNQL